jgi:hypothetical protein
LQFRAVIFDLGGVVFPSPFAAFPGLRGSEQARPPLHQRGHHAAVTSVRGRGSSAGSSDSTTSRVAFEAECSAASGTVVVADLFGSMTSGTSGSSEMVTTQSLPIRARLRTAALTNNWADADGRT